MSDPQRLSEIVRGFNYSYNPDAEAVRQQDVGRTDVATRIAGLLGAREEFLNPAEGSDEATRLAEVEKINDELHHAFVEKAEHKRDS